LDRELQVAVLIQVVLVDLELLEVLVALVVLQVHLLLVVLEPQLFLLDLEVLVEVLVELADNISVDILVHM